MIKNQIKLIYLKYQQLQSILLSIDSSFSEPIERKDFFIQNVFPIPPTIYISSSNNIIYELNKINVIFPNIQNNIVNILYAYIFYEKYYSNNKSNIYYYQKHLS